MRDANELRAAAKALQRMADQLERGQRGRRAPRTADDAGSRPAAGRRPPTRSTVSRLAEGYLEIEALLVESERLGYDRRRARRQRMRAAHVLRDHLGTVMTDPETAGPIADLSMTPFDAQQLVGDARSRFFTVEADLLHVAGLPRAEAGRLVDEGWTLARSRPVALVSGEQIMDKLAEVHARLHAAEDELAAWLQQPDPAVSAPADAAGPARPWWRRVRGRRLLWIAGGVLITAANVGAAGTLAAATAGAGAALVGVSANLGTSMVFQGFGPDR